MELIKKFTTVVEMTSEQYLELGPCAGGLNGSAIGILIDDPINDGFGAAAGFVRFVPVKAVRIGHSSLFKATLMLEYKELDKEGVLGSWNSFFDPEALEYVNVEIYKKFDFDAILNSSWVWTEIKENK